MTQLDPAIWTIPPAFEMRDLLARLELVSAGTTASWGASGGGDSSGDPAPESGDPNPPHLHYRESYERAHHDDLEHEHRDGGPTSRQRRRVIRAAAEELERLTGRGSALERPAGESRDDLAQRIVSEGRGYTVDEAAVHFRCGPRDITKARIAGNRAIDNGDPLEPNTEHDRAAALERAVRMADDGMTVRQIAWTTGLPKSTVNDHLRKRAA